MFVWFLILSLLPLISADFVTDFGSKWLESALKEMEEDRKQKKKRRILKRRRRELIVQQQQESSTQQLDVGDSRQQREESDGPLAKRRKRDENDDVSSQQQSQAQPPQSSLPLPTLLLDDEGEIVPEEQKLVPGMGGLSVEFVRNAFYSGDSAGVDDNGGENRVSSSVSEEICSTQLPRGRYVCDAFLRR